MSEELKACPFCGEQPSVTVGTSFTSVVCDECGYEFDWPTHGETDWKAEWNTRPGEDALRATLAQRDAEIAAVRERCEDLEARLDLYHGNMYDVVVAENQRLTAEIAEQRSRAEAATRRWNRAIEIHPDLENIPTE